MRILPSGWLKRSALAAVAVLAGGIVGSEVLMIDRFFWPRSAHDRIESMAAIIRRIKSPARWCHSSDNPANVYVFDPRQEEQDFGRCLSSIAPVSDFQETSPGEYIKRFYRAEIGDKFCEVTLSTVFTNDRIVGSDCYFGFFPKAKDTGVGMTDDKFG